MCIYRDINCGVGMFYCLTAINTGGVVMHNLCIVIDSALSLQKQVFFVFTYFSGRSWLTIGVKWALGLEKVGYHCQRTWYSHSLESNECEYQVLWHEKVWEPLLNKGCKADNCKANENIPKERCCGFRQLYWVALSADSLCGSEGGREGSADGPAASSSSSITTMDSSATPGVAQRLCSVCWK